MPKYLGWLPFGTDDDSLVFAHDLKSPIVAADISGKWSNLVMVGAGTTPTHHSEYGMKAIDAAGDDTGYRFQTQNAALDILDRGGQICVQVQKEWLCTENAASFTSGDSYATAQRLFSVLTGDGLAGGFFQKSTAFYMGFPGPATINLDFHYGLPSGVTAGATLNCHSYGKDDFVDLCIGWDGGANGGLVYVQYGGLLAIYGVRAHAALSKLLNNFYVGSDRGNANTFINTRYMRNLQICSRPPSFSRSPVLSRIAFLSDSLTDDLAVVHSTSYDNVSWASMLRKFHQAGLYPGQVTVDENSGYVIGTSGGTQLETRVSAILAYQPTIVPTCGGTNDADNGVSYTGADFLAEYKDLIEQLFLGTAKTSRTTVEYVPLIMPPPRSDAVTDAQTAANHADIRTQIQSLPDWWDTTYGATYGNGRVFIGADLFALAGGHDWANRSGYTTDGVHLAANMNYLYGNELGRNILANI